MVVFYHTSPVEKAVDVRGQLSPLGSSLGPFIFRLQFGHGHKPLPDRLWPFAMISKRSRPE